MCGICGMAFDDNATLASVLVRHAMRDSLTHRGPDDAGEFVAPGIFLGSRRLSILDLSPRGHMPMAGASGRYRIAYNGEVYNFAELRNGLEARGYRFRSNTDTEVVLNLYIDRGPAMLDQLNGMFAFAVWDTEDRTLFLARDRLGVKPLFYATQKGVLYFASEQKALAAAGVDCGFDPDTWEELLCFRYVAGECTSLRGVKRLLPGHSLTWKNGRIAIQRWWNLAERARAVQSGLPRESAAWFRGTFDHSVSLRRISDVPVGVLLSGGLDSSSVASSLAAQGGAGAASFTVRFEEPQYDEGPLAREVSGRWNLEHHELRLSERDLFDTVREASALNDEPLTHGNDAHLLAISRFAKPRVTVLLSGEGGDETLGGYVRYRPLRYPGMLSLMRPILPPLARIAGLNGRAGRLSRLVELGSTARMVLFNSCETLPSDLTAIGFEPQARFAFREQVLADAQGLYPHDPMRQAMYCDQHTYLCSILDRNDRMTMGASIECRVPFLDYRLVEGLAAMPSAALFAGSGSKPLLRRACGNRLPANILRHRKWGFGVPWSAYLRRSPRFREFLSEVPDLEPLRSAPLSRHQVRRLISAFLAGDAAHDGLVRQLFTVALWHDSVRKNLVGQTV